MPSATVTSTLAALTALTSPLLLAGSGVAGYVVTGTTVGPGFSRPEGIKLNLAAGCYTLDEADNGTVISTVEGVGTTDRCHVECKRVAACVAWTWVTGAHPTAADHFKCRLHSDTANVTEAGAVRGTGSC